MKYKTKKILKIIGVCLLFGVLLSFGLSLMDGGSISNPLKKEINDKNLITEECYLENNFEGETKGGMKITWKDDGTFVLSGKSDVEELSNKDKIEYNFAQITMLTPGTYTLSANNKDASEDTFGLFIKYGDKTVYTDKDGEVTFDVEEASTAIIGWYVLDEHLIVYEKVAPTLIDGKDAIQFYK